MSFLKKLSLLIPFLNEFSNLLTIVFPENIKIYQENPENKTNLFLKITIDLISFISILWISYYTYKKHNNHIYGFVKVSVLLIFAFLIPNIFMKDILNIFFKKFKIKNKLIKLLVGLFLIFILLLIELFSFEFIKIIIKKHLK